MQSQLVLGFQDCHAMWTKYGPKIVRRILVPVAATPGREAAATDNTQPLLRHGLVIS